VISRKSHFQGIECKIDIGAVLVASRSQVALDHLDRVLRHAAAVLTCTLPITIGDLGDDFTPLFDGLEYCADIEVPIQCAFDSDLNVVEVDKYRDF